MTINQHDNELIDSDNAQAWHQHNELLRRQREEETPTIDAREAIERLNQAAAVLDVLNPKIQKLRKDLIALRNELEQQNKHLAEEFLDAARENGLL
tara:strand:+ start:247 stop:534 length:288 start_codon:yes stop_codon:yes gene_type:complete